jgi:hypothetical protein
MAPSMELSHSDYGDQDQQSVALAGRPNKTSRANSVGYESPLSERVPEGKSIVRDAMVPRCSCSSSVTDREVNPVGPTLGCNLEDTNHAAVRQLHDVVLKCFWPMYPKHINQLK